MSSRWRPYSHNRALPLWLKLYIKSLSTWCSCSRESKFFSSRYRGSSCSMRKRFKLASLEMAPSRNVNCHAPQWFGGLLSPKPMDMPSVLFSPRLTFQTEGGLTCCFCFCRPLGTCSLISTICHHKEQGGQRHGSSVAKPSGNTYLCLVVWEQHGGLYSLWTEIKIILEELSDGGGRERGIWECFWIVTHTRKL